MERAADLREDGIIRGEFFTDGKSFVFRLAGTPLAGTGETPAAAFADLMRVQDLSGTFAQRLRQLARDQQGERVRAAIVRGLLAGLIVLGVMAGALVTAAGMAPKVASQVTASTMEEVRRSLERMSPATEAKIADTLRRVQGLQSCSPAGNIAPDPAR